MGVQKGKGMQSSALPRAAAGRDGARSAHVCGSAEPRGGSGVTQIPPGPPALPCPAPCPAVLTLSLRGAALRQRGGLGLRLPPALAAGSAPLSPRRRGPQAEGEQRQPPHGAARHPGTAGHGSAQHGQPDGRPGAAAPALYRAGRAGGGGRRRPSAHWPGRAGGRAGTATAPSPAGWEARPPSSTAAVPFCRTSG